MFPIFEYYCFIASTFSTVYYCISSTSLLFSVDAPQEPHTQNNLITIELAIKYKKFHVSYKILTSNDRDTYYFVLIIFYLSRPYSQKISTPWFHPCAKILPLETLHSYENKYGNFAFTTSKQRETHGSIVYAINFKSLPVYCTSKVKTEELYQFNNACENHSNKLARLNTPITLKYEKF